MPRNGTMITRRGERGSEGGEEESWKSGEQRNEGAKAMLDIRKGGGGGRSNEEVGLAANSEFP